MAHVNKEWRPIAALLLFASVCACSSVDAEADKALVAAKQMIGQGKLVAALPALEELAKKYPGTLAGREAASLAIPLAAQRSEAENACAAYGMDMGEPLGEIANLFERPASSNAPHWRGPYTTRARVGQFGEWAGATSCGSFPDRWPADNRPGDGL